MTEYHVGRLIDHIHLRVTDLERSARFYEAVLRALDPAITTERGDGWAAADELFLSDDGLPTPMHLAFQAEDEAFHGPLARSSASVVLTPIVTP